MLQGSVGPAPWRHAHLWPHLDTCPELPKPSLLLSNRISARTGRGRRSAALLDRGAGVRSLLWLSSLWGIQSVLVAMKTGRTPAVPDRGSQVRRRTHPSAHEQCCSEPARHGLRRQLRRCRCHYGPLQSEGGAAWLGAGGSQPLVGSGGSGGARADLGGLRWRGGGGVAGLPAPSSCSGSRASATDPPCLLRPPTRSASSSGGTWRSRGCWIR